MTMTTTTTTTTATTTPVTNNKRAMHVEQVPFGRIHADIVDFGGALDRIVELCRAGQGGMVVTPNVDHVVMAETDPALQKVYDDADLSLTDGKPLVWLAKAMGRPVPAKISGSDLIRPLIARAAKEGLSCFFFGGMEGIAEKAAAILKAEHQDLIVAGCHSPPFGFEKDPAKDRAAIDVVLAAKPNIVFVALGSPKQELWMDRHRHDLGAAVTLGIGASLDFIAGAVKRAPPWMSHMGLEWLYRLVQEPGRMYERYLVRDRAIVGIAWRTWKKHRR
jgi:N-acetylglucosaminyldiphosphoundecaprenol N-acetyl-beta-D-mannosaminyltransferase